jgi:tetratricopeptide (TPR) repeat protein
MPKQERRPLSSTAVRPASRTASTRQPGSATGFRVAKPAGTASSPRRSTYIEAVAIYETAMTAFQRRDFQGAADHLQRILTGFPTETELLERVRLHLSVCERHLRPPSAEPQTTEERIYAATMALNEGAVPRALTLLEPVGEADPLSDQALYLRAVAHTEQEQYNRAVDLLKRAIESNPENRGRARVDPDLDQLRHIDGVAALLEAPRRLSIDPPRPIRTRR